MGWLFPYDAYTKNILKDQIRRDCEDYFIAERSVGNHYYLLLKHPDTEDPFIIQFLLAQRCGTWGYKDIDESMGPYDATCPDSLLDMAGDAPNEYAENWRLRCRDQNRQKREHRRLVRSIKVGDTIRLRPGCTPETLRVTSTTRGIHATHNGWAYRVKPRHIASKVSA